MMLYEWHRQWEPATGAAQERRDRAARPAGAGTDPLELPQRLALEVDRPGFNAEGNDVAIETLELAHEGSNERSVRRWLAGVESQAIECRPTDSKLGLGIREQPYG